MVLCECLCCTFEAVHVSNTIKVNKTILVWNFHIVYSLSTVLDLLFIQRDFVIRCDRRLLIKLLMKCCHSKEYSPSFCCRHPFYFLICFLSLLCLVSLKVNSFSILPIDTSQQSLMFAAFYFPNVKLHHWLAGKNAILSMKIGPWDEGYTDPHWGIDIGIRPGWIKCTIVHGIDFAI